MALRNLDEEASYIAKDDAKAARIVVERVLGAVAMLADQPGIGRPGRVPGTRELVVKKTRYIVPYRVRGEAVEVLRVFHTSGACRRSGDPAAQSCMNSELDVLRDVVARLEGAAIPYMLTGSVAMSVYAEPRMTRDIDIVVELTAGDAGRVVELFTPDYYVSDEAVRAAISARGLFNLFNLSRLVKVDLIVRKDDEFQRHQFARRRRHDLGGSSIWVIDKEDLILAKLAWAAPSGSTFQLRDVRKLLAAGADEAYLDEWSRKLGVDTLLRKCMDAGHDT